MSASITGIILGKILRFAVGWAITGTAVIVGIRHGRALAAAQVTGENYFEKTPINWPRLLVMIGSLLAGVYGLVQLDKRVPLFEWLAPYGSQFSMITLRSLLFFLFAVQWQIWADKTRLKRALPILLFSLVVFLAVEILVLWPSILLVRHELARDGTVLQTTTTTCTPSGLANILRAYGRPVRESDVTAAMATGMGGTSNLEAAEGAKKLGFPEAAPWRPTLAQIAAEDLPLLVSIDSCGVKHSVALLGLSTHTITIADPLTGLTHYTRQQFEKEWFPDAVRLGTPSFPCSAPPRLSTFDPKRFQALSWSLEAP